MNLKSLVFVFTLSAATLYAQSRDKIIEFDYAQFGYDSTSNYVEFYYSFNQSVLTVAKTDSGDYVEGYLKINILNNISNETVVDHEWQIVNKIEPEPGEGDKSLIGVVGFVLPEGEFTLNISGKDAQNNKNELTIPDRIKVVPLMGKAQFSVSDIQLASRIIPDSENTKSIFYKNKHEIIPQPTSVFGETQPVVFYYSELYNLDSEDNRGDLIINQLVFNSRGDTVLSKKKQISRTVPSRVEVGTVMINKLPTDSYTLALSVIDSAKDYGVFSTKRFFVYNPNVAPIVQAGGKTTESLGSQFNIMSEEELDDLFEKARYITSSLEIQQYNKLTSIEGKREFLFNFWKAREGVVAPRSAPFREYIRRVDHSNSAFGSMSKRGWRSDRGRVYIMFGEPSEIERYPSQVDSKPYEIWHYNEIEGGVIFIFADVSGFSEYLLLHSTMRGELRDENWGRRISH